MKTVILTGATSGVGRGAALGLANQGARLVLLGRPSPARDQAVRELEGLGAPSVEAVDCDLGCLASVRDAVLVLARLPPADALVSCAGILPWRRRTTPEGIEAVWATNVLGPILLTELLLRSSAAPRRVVTISGDLHRYGRIRWDDPELARGYHAARAGTQSVLAKLMWTLELSRRTEAATVNAFCPGAVRSGLTRDFPALLRPLLALSQRLAKPPEEGGRTAVWLATAPELEGATGGYYRDLRPARPSAAALDPEAQQRLVAMVHAAIGLA